MPRSPATVMRASARPPIGNLAGIDYRRRSAENMIDALMTLQRLGRQPGDRSWRHAIMRPKPHVHVLDGFRRSELRVANTLVNPRTLPSARSGTMRGPDIMISTGLAALRFRTKALRRRRRFRRSADHRPEVRSQGRRGRADRAAGRSTAASACTARFSVYPPLFQYWEEIVLNNPYKYAVGQGWRRRLVRSRRTGSRTWIPNYVAIDAERQPRQRRCLTRLRSVPDGPVDEVRHASASLGEDCRTFDGTAAPRRATERR